MSDTDTGASSDGAGTGADERADKHGDDMLATLLLGREPHFARRDAARERAALARLVHELAADPQSLQQSIADVVRELCGADGVVLAVHETGLDGEAVRWTAASGKLAGQAGSRWPLEACPCGHTIRSGVPVLFERPGDGFDSLRAAGIPVGEILGVPWRVRGRTAGALAAILPDGGAHFDADDMALLEACADFAAASQQAGAPGDGELERQFERRVEARLRPVLEIKESLQREVEERRATERALREHKALVDATLSIGTVGVVYFDLDGTIRDVNPAFERMSGYAREELQTLSHWKDMTPPEFWQVTARAREDLAERGVTMPYTKQMLRKDGSRWWGLFAPARIWGSGKGARCVMFVLDVSENKETEARLSESERRFRLLFEAMDEGFLLATVHFDGNGRAQALEYAEANPAAVRMLGVRHAAPGLLKLQRDREPCWLEACAQVVRSSVSTRAQCFAQVPQCWYDFFVYPVGGEEGPRVAILFRDITLRKHAEDALRESEARFRALADACPALVYQFDLDGNLIYLNQRCMAAPPATDGVAAHGAQEAGGRWRSIPRPEDMDGYLRTVFEGILAHGSYTQRIHTTVSGGGQHWFEAHAAPWYSGDGEHRGYVGISLDITGGVLAEEALKDADRRKDEFLATLAHELRNPLAPISNAVQLMRRPDGRRQSDRVVEMVGRQVRQIVRLVDDLMEVSRITRGKIDLKLERMPFAEVVHSAVETSQLMIERAGHQLSVSLPEEPLMLRADRLRLTQVFANLLNNAAKYTDAGGRIWFDVRRDGDHVLASVRDTGIGIPPDALPRVFDMFAQAHRALGRGQGGLGIGLTMVRSLVEMHDGTVEARSAGSGQGSEFIVRLPLLDQADEEAGAGAGVSGLARPDAPFAGQRILVVDDNRDAADTLGLLLESDGAEVRVVYDGRAALAVADSFAPTSVLLDIGMPGMDGFEVARRLRQDPRFTQLRIVALTGWGQDTDRRQTSNRGFSHHLTKPVSIEELQKVLT